MEAVGGQLMDFHVCAMDLYTCIFTIVSGPRLANKSRKLLNQVGLAHSVDIGTHDECDRLGDAT